ncbi:MAG: hypothetical protein HYX75_00505 [Acidobacteria bacterium]|nr:hypothetical protein [Acidobacteriota bacterium]
MGSDREATEVFVLRTASGYRVRPAYVAASPGQDVHFVNLTGGRVQIFFPDRSAFGTERKDVAPGRTASITIPERAETGHFPYAAYSEEARDFCLGESSPEVIIRR